MDSYRARLYGALVDQTGPLPEPRVLVLARHGSDHELLNQLVEREGLTPASIAVALLEGSRWGDEDLVALVRTFPRTIVVVVADFEDRHAWIQRLGPRDMLFRPLDPQESLFKLHAALELSKLRAEAGAPVPVSGDEARLNLALEAGNIGSWIWDLESNHSYWNRQEFELLGLPPVRRPVASDLFFQHVHPADRAPLEQSLTEALNTGEDWQGQFRIIRADGQTRWLSARGRVTARDPASGKPVQMSGVNFDITASKLAESRLREADERMNLLIESLRGYAIYLLDPQGLVTTWNVGAQRLLGYGLREVVGRSIKVLYPEDGEARLYAELTEARELGSCQRRNGEERSTEDKSSWTVKRQR